MTRDRLVYGGLGALLLAVVLVAVAINSGIEERTGRPATLEDVQPAPGSLVPPQTTVIVDVPNEYRIELFIEVFTSEGATWVRIPDSEINSTLAATGQYSWKPDPSHFIQEWTPGNQRMRVTWDTIAGVPDPGEYVWSFRVG